MQSNKGFSLIELLIVVAIIGIIAAIAIPNFTSSRIAANEASAISSIRTLVTAQFTYAATRGNGLFANSMADFGGTPPMIDEQLRSNVKSGYSFSLATTGDRQGFTFTAAPQQANVSGIRTFTANESGVIYDVTNGNQPVGGGGASGS
ncbi:MAG TPA: prepilin-type N-terminal cleavage/methylation domain-containing protein [Acidobacteriota bacterium]|mgnify:CR=1 FL=1|nr:prepilin-type N-terminal cleavage/methylation domain-containing protein [Acidobacteriota bacterium]